MIDDSGDAPVPPFAPEICTTSASAFTTPAAIVPTPASRHELHRHVGDRVDLLQVVDELREVLDRVDVVVRRRRDEPDAGLGVPQPRDLGADLVAGQLPALAGLRALGDLDVELVGEHAVLGCDAEAARTRSA